MVKKKEIKKKEIEEKVIHIKLKKPMHEILNDYCKDAGIDKPDFQNGYICGARSDLAEPLFLSNQVHFFAGIHFALTGKKFYDHKLVSKEESDILDKKCIKEYKKKTKSVDYMG